MGGKRNKGPCVERSAGVTSMLGSERDDQYGSQVSPRLVSPGGAILVITARPTWAWLTPSSPTGRLVWTSQADLLTRASGAQALAGCIVELTEAPQVQLSESLRALRRRIWGLPVTGILPNATGADDRPAEHWRMLLEPPSFSVPFEHAVWGGEALLTASIDELGRTWASVLTDGLQAYARRWRLSPGQREVIHLSLQGIERAQLARAIHISEDGLKWRIKGLLRKCGARSLHDAVLGVVSECLVCALTLETGGVLGALGADIRHILVAPLALAPAETLFRPERFGPEAKTGSMLAIDP